MCTTRIAATVSRPECIILTHVVFAGTERVKENTTVRPTISRIIYRKRNPYARRTIHSSSSRHVRRVLEVTKNNHFRNASVNSTQLVNAFVAAFDAQSFSVRTRIRLRRSSDDRIRLSIHIHTYVDARVGGLTLSRNPAVSDAREV